MRPLVIAHRGASGVAPENTLAAFRRAVEIGADMVELDVQLSRDGQVMVFHDDSLERTTDGSGLLAAQDCAALQRLDAGGWFAPAFRGERIPTLAAALAACPLRINVELKAPGTEALAAATLSVVRAAGALDRVVFSSFQPSLLEATRARAPEARLAVLWNWGPFPDALRLSERVGARAVHIRKDLVSPEVGSLAAQSGVALCAWTVNDTGEGAELLRRGVTGLFTDHPERFLQPIPATS